MTSDLVGLGQIVPKNRKRKRTDISIRHTCWTIGVTTGWLLCSFGLTALIHAHAFAQDAKKGAVAVEEKAAVKAAANAAAQPESARAAYIIEVPVPLIGARDEAVQQQINQVAARTRGDGQRPIVVLHFTSSSKGNNNLASSASRGTRFERGLALARFLTSPAASKVRLIAYLTEVIEGHAVLPVLACEEIIVAPEAELGQAAIDEPNVDDTVRGAYRDIVRSRGIISQAAVSAMLDANVEVLRVELTDGDVRVVTSDEAKELRDAKKVVSEERIWSGGGLASFNSTRMRQLRWVSQVVNDETALATALDINGRLQPVRSLPDKIEAARLEIDKDLNATLVNQMIRATGEKITKSKVNLLVVNVHDVNADFSDALRLAQYLAGLEADGVATAAVIHESTASPAVMTAFACDHVYLVQSAQIGSTRKKPGAVQRLSEANRQALVELENATARSASFMTAAIDPDCSVKLYIEKETGRQMPMAEWRLDMQSQPDAWIARETLTEGGEVNQTIALRFGMIDSTVADPDAALKEMSLTAPPDSVEGPWLETTIQRILAREWLPRLLVVIGFMALMIEMGTPGLGIGGFVAGLCFLAFFWIEALNGNVEWLEILLFVAGMISLAIEFFVVPGFGLFGISGILMVLGAIVLASQTFVLPNNSEQLTIIANNLFWVAICALIVMVGAVFMGKRLENTPVLRWVTIEPAGTDDVAELEEREAIVHWEHLLGQDGITTTRLNPSGKAQFGRMIVNVLGTNSIDEGVAVRVVEVRGNSVFVEPLE